MLQTVELYGSKLVAAMDRQHPRDIFDVLQMYSGFGLQPEVVSCFVAYLAGHNRPVHEVLFSPAKDIEALYHRHFVGMTRDPIGLDALRQTQVKLLRDLPRALAPEQRESAVVRPHGAGVGTDAVSKLRDLPGIRWKISNLLKLRAKDCARFELQEKALEELFSAIER